MFRDSTRIAVVHDGSTRRELEERKDRSEEARIQSFWKAKAWRSPDALALEPSCLLRNKLFVLDLAQQDYLSDLQESQNCPTIEDYCQRYAGLGDFLEHSIYTRLTVAKALHSNPELWQLNDQFEWPTPGKTFLDFRVVEELGRGALGRVFLCQQLRVAERYVAVKVEIGDSRVEPALQGKLSHRNIVPILSANYDQATDTSYLCMPFFGRSTLVDLIQLAFLNEVPISAQTVLDAGQLGLRESDRELIQSIEPLGHLSGRTSYVSTIRSLALQLSDALAHAHEHGVIHGDIKPSNVLLTPHAVPLLFDFNLGNYSQEEAGLPGGTLAYMSPEQLRFAFMPDLDSAESDFRADIYSFGALLYELLTGKTPFDVPDVTTVSKEEVAQSLLSQQRRGCATITELNPSVDPDFAALVHWCLAYDPDERPDSVRSIHDQLGRQSTTTARAKRQLRTHPRRTALGLMASLTVVLGTGSYYVNQPSLLEQAIFAQRRGDYEESVRLLSAALERDGSSRELRLQRVRSNLMLNHFAEAQADLAQLWIEEQTDTALYALNGYFGNLVGEHRSAAFDYRLAIENGLVTPELLNNFAVSRRVEMSRVSLRERLQEASDLYQQGIGLDPDSIVLRSNAMIVETLRLGLEDLEGVSHAVSYAKWLHTNASSYQAVHSNIAALKHALRELGETELVDSLPAELDPSLIDPSKRIPSFLDPLLRYETFYPLRARD